MLCLSDILGKHKLSLWCVLRRLLSNRIEGGEQQESTRLRYCVFDTMTARRQWVSRQLSERLEDIKGLWKACPPLTNHGHTDTIAQPGLVNGKQQQRRRRALVSLPTQCSPHQQGKHAQKGGCSEMVQKYLWIILLQVVLVSAFTLALGFYIQARNTSTRTSGGNTHTVWAEIKMSKKFLLAKIKD